MRRHATYPRDKAHDRPFSLLILPGDGIGPEVMAEVRKVIDWFGTQGIAFDVSEDLVGGAAYDAHGTPLTDETMAKAQEVDAVLLGAVGGPKYDVLDFSVKPERGLLRLRKEMDLYANLRPAQCFDALADFSSLKKDVVAGLDIMIIRELTSGVYFGEPRGIHTEGNERVGINTQRYTESEIARVARSAFELARKRGNKVCSMEKANVMESGVLWRDVVQEIHDAEYPDVELSPHVCRRRRDAADPLAQAVRRDRDRQPVRRPAVRPCRDADRLARHAALGLARRADGKRPAQGAL
jgi:3-isopropylmalate dehydrogenase